MRDLLERNILIGRINIDDSHFSPQGSEELGHAIAIGGLSWARRTDDDLTENGDIACGGGGGSHDFE